MSPSAELSEGLRISLWPWHEHVAEALPWASPGLPKAIVSFQNVHDGAHWGAQYPVHGEQGSISPFLVVGSNAAVLNAQALHRTGPEERRAGYASIWDRAWNGELRSGG